MFDDLAVFQRCLNRRENDSAVQYTRTVMYYSTVQRIVAQHCSTYSGHRTCVLVVVLFFCGLGVMIGTYLGVAICPSCVFCFSLLRLSSQKRTLGIHHGPEEEEEARVAPQGPEEEVG